MRISPHFNDYEFRVNQPYDYTDNTQLGSPYQRAIPFGLILALESYREFLVEDFERQLSLDDSVFKGIFVTSFARTFYYNETVGGHPNSKHLYAYLDDKLPEAVDFSTFNFSSFSHYDIVARVQEHAKKYNVFLSFGIYSDKKFIHVNLEDSAGDMKVWTS